MAFYDGETTKNYLYLRFLVFYEIFRLVGRVSRIADISITLERGLNEVLVTSVIIVIADMIYVPFPIVREIFNCRFRANLTLGFSIGVLELHWSIFKISLYLAIINIVRMIK